MLNYSPIIVVYMLVVAALFGLAMGSFVNCWAWRYLHGESVMRGRSHCTSCGHDLSARDLVPVLSWVASGGKCRYCGQGISIRYPLTELVTAAAFVGIVAVYGISVETVELLAFACILLFLSLTDIEEYLIPNGCIIAALVVRIAYLMYAYATGLMDLNLIGYFVASAFGMGTVLLVIVLVADKAFGRASMGGGDLKLFFVAALYFGWQQGLFLVILSCVFGLIAAFAFPAPREKTADDAGEAEKDESADGGLRPAAPTESAEPAEPESRLRRSFPFGPSIALACIVTMLVGNPVISWYLGLL